jgi:hypothetical protein
VKESSVSESMPLSTRRKPVTVEGRPKRRSAWSRVWLPLRGEGDGVSRVVLFESEKECSKLKGSTRGKKKRGGCRTQSECHPVSR